MAGQVKVDDAHISETYIPYWGLREALRGLVTNFFDEFRKLFPSHDEIHPIPHKRTKPATATAPVEEFYITVNLAMSSPGYEFVSLARWNPDTKQLDDLGSFDAIDMKTRAVVGKIRWYGGMLRLEYPGTMKPSDWYLGGGGEGPSQVLPHIEGYVGLHFDHVPDCESVSNEGKVIVEIIHITLEEWIGTCENNQGVHGFLELISALRRTPGFEDDDPRAVYGAKGRLGGSLLLNPRYRGKIFNNGVWMCSYLHSFEFGYSLNKLTTNRDRHVVVNVAEQRMKIGDILHDILDNY